MDVPTRSFVISWMGLLGSASLVTIRHYLVFTGSHKMLTETCTRKRQEKAAVPLHQCAGLSRGLGTNPCRELNLTMSPPLLALSTGSVRTFPWSLYERAASQSAANFRRHRVSFLNRPSS